MDYLDWLRQNANGTVLELGVREGESTIAILEGLSQRAEHDRYLEIVSFKHLYSVDRDDPKNAISNSNWTFIKADSQTEPEQERILQICGKRDNNFRLDLLFVDADHSYAGCMSDLTAFGKWANVIAIHDTESEFSGVWESVIAYYRCKWNGPFRNSQFFNDGHGLGVLRR